MNVTFEIKLFKHLKVCHASEVQPQVGEKLSRITWWIKGLRF